jgi:hypothetical protein
VQWIVSWKAQPLQNKKSELKGMNKNDAMTAEDISLISIRMTENISQKARDDISFQYSELNFPMFRDADFFGAELNIHIIHLLGEEVYNLETEHYKLP